MTLPPTNTPNRGNARVPLPDTQPIAARLAGAGSVLRELEAVLAAASPDTPIQVFRASILDSNTAEKGSASSRLKAWSRLKPRYLLDGSFVEFRAFGAAMRDATAPADRGLIALLMFARNDRLFREVTLDRVSPFLDRDGVLIERKTIECAVSQRGVSGGKPWTTETVITASQHVLSSLKDFGVLKGSARKRTVRPHPGALVAIFALRLARIEGLTDRQALESRWFRLLGLDRARTVDLLYAARRDGALDFRMQADVVEIELPSLESP